MGSGCLKRNMFISSLGIMGEIEKQIMLFQMSDLKNNGIISCIPVAKIKI